MYSKQKEKIENLFSMFKISFADPIDLKNGTGFLVYSDETIDNTSNSELKHKYENECKEIKNKTERNIYRYYYYENFKNKKQLHATIVMMNPAFADSVESDNTIKNIEKYLNNEKDSILKHLPNIYNEFGSFDIINLYPVRMPKSEKLNEFLELTKIETEKYQKFVKEYLSKIDKNHIVIAAWGDDKKDNELARKLFADLDIKFYCYGLTKNGYPKHFSSLAYNNFNKFRCPLPYIKINNWIKEPSLSDYDKERLADVRNLKQWLTSSPSISQYYVDYMNGLLKDVFKQVE
ncbi:DUF1643 domain-containing protein [bacterium]|nr:DUF1643 domain-containing protein [bacterium]